MSTIWFFLDGWKPSHSDVFSEFSLMSLGPWFTITFQFDLPIYRRHQTGLILQIGFFGVRNCVDYINVI